MISKEVQKINQYSAYRLSGNSLEDFDLFFLQLENEKKNKIYSPLSIKYALEMLEEGANGETKDQINSMDIITIDGHTLVDVPYYMHFNNDLANSYFLPEIIDNTDIYKICKALLSD